MVKFKAVIDEADLLKDSINAISTLLNEAVFKVSKSGIEGNGCCKCCNGGYVTACKRVQDF